MCTDKAGNKTLGKHAALTDIFRVTQRKSFGEILPDGDSRPFESKLLPKWSKVAQTYQTHCDICPMSHRVALTSGKMELKTRYFLQNIAFLSQSRSSIANAPPVVS